MASLLPRALARRPLTACSGAAPSRALHSHSLLPRAAPSPASRRLTCRPSSATTSSTRPAMLPKTASSPVRVPAARRFYSSGSPPPPPPKTHNIKFWPFFIVIGLGSTGYVLLVNERNKYKMGEKKPHSGGMPGGDSSAHPAFSPDDVTVVFVLGGPGAGKGTQCARLVSTYGFTHLSAGDLLRAEQDRPGSAFGQLIRDCIRDGAIVPMEVTVKLLENAMAATIAAADPAKKPHKFLIDGFPRKMDQAIAFESTVCPAQLVLFYDCPEDELERRLMERGKTSGRADDNAASIRKRFRTFVDTSMPVVDAYAKEGRVVHIDATPSPDAVFADTQKQLTARLSL